MRDYARLFSPLRVGSLTLRNRIVMPPMVTNMQVGSDQAHAWCVARARGGVGLIIREATAIRRLADPIFTGRLKRTVDAVHRAGAAIAVQLMEWGRTASGETIAASARDDAREATEAELLDLIRLCARAAVECRRIGFDGVEPHGAHGYFLNQFFSPVSNRRADAFGGSLEKRMQMALRIVRAIGDVDILDVSPSTSSDQAPRADMTDLLKEVVTTTVIAVGGFGPDLEAAESVLEQGRADLIAIGRGLRSDSELPNKVIDGREIIECKRCNEKCLGNLRKATPIGCAQNERSGREYLYVDPV